MTDANDTELVVALVGERLDDGRPRRLDDGRPVALATVAVAGPVDEHAPMTDGTAAASSEGRILFATGGELLRCSASSDEFPQRWSAICSAIQLLRSNDTELVAAICSTSSHQRY